MRSIRITHTIYLLLGGALLAGAIASAYLTVRCAGINNAYSRIILQEVSQAQQVRVVQVNFKKQVQAWKDILLRGRDDAALTKYSKEFADQGRHVEEDAERLSKSVGDAEVRQGLERFLAEHRSLEQSYASALEGYKASRESSVADAAVKGKDRQPTDTLDGVVTRLTAEAEQMPAAESARLQREQYVVSVLLVLLWSALGAWSVVFARSLGVRMNRSVGYVQQIAGGDLTVAAPEEGKTDELGELIEAMGRMREQLRGVLREMQAVSKILSEGAGDVARSSGQIAKATTEQRGQSEQVASALEEMIASIGEVARHCHEANVEAERTGELAEASSRNVEGVAGEIRGLSKDAERNAEAVRGLGERSREIGQIVNLIEEIAAQTNLLALNASIESARAGEHGRGFAVVAGEVRRLAERTAGATREITEAVRTVQKETSAVVESIHQTTERVGRSVKVANEAAQSLEVLGESAAEVRQRISQIAQNSEEQSEASGLVGRSMNEMAASIAASSEGAEEAARTSGSLAEVAGKLESQSSRFKTGGQEESPRQTRREAA